MAMQIESYVPEIIVAGGINTLKPVVLGSTLSVAGQTTFFGGTVTDYTPTAANATATLTPAQVQAHYITSTSAAATTLTLPTGTLLGAALGATQGTIFELYIDNTAGANTVTIAVAVNGVLSAAAVAGATAGFGLLTVPAGVTGVGRFTIIFTSPTAYVFSRTA